ncbi:TPA: hypothetical protein ACH3X2_001070 [Trebouxia sp. C0005]
MARWLTLIALQIMTKSEPPRATRAGQAGLSAAKVQVAQPLALPRLGAGGTAWPPLASALDERVFAR